MNVHFLELFYYVAKHQGISAAVRHIPYGIQQPAVSTQMGKLERDLEAKLFERVPFRLTPAGEKLYEHVAPFFDHLPIVLSHMRASVETELRIGGAELILRDHLPAVLSRVKKQFPRLRYRLRTIGHQDEPEDWLRAGEVDLMFLPLTPRPPAKLKQRPMAKFPFALQVHPRSGYKSAEQIFAQRRISAPLICLPETTSFARAFQSELRRRHLHWPQTIEATSLDLVHRYVANGDGVGVNVHIPARKRARDVRELVLTDFPRITMGAVWRGELSPAARALVEGIHAYARENWPDCAC
jgi:DNA-binding transcriptional LysR family regulator